MSSDEEMAAIGRLMTEYTDTKRHLAALHTETERIGKLLQYTGAVIQHKNTSLISPITEEHLAVLDREKLTSLVADINSSFDRLNTLRTRLSDLGLPT